MAEVSQNFQGLRLRTNSGASNEEAIAGTTKQRQEGPSKRGKEATIIYAQNDIIQIFKQRKISMSTPIVLLRLTTPELFHSESQLPVTIESNLQANPNDGVIQSTKTPGKFQRNNPRVITPFSNFLDLNDPSARNWYYLDEASIVRGPFDSLEMDKWYNDGYFFNELMISHDSKTNFMRLSELITKVQAQRRQNDHSPKHGKSNMEGSAVSLFNFDEKPALSSSNLFNNKAPAKPRSISFTMAPNKELFPVREEGLEFNFPIQHPDRNPAGITHPNRQEPRAQAEIKRGPESQDFPSYENKSLGTFSEGQSDKGGMSKEDFREDDKFQKMKPASKVIRYSRVQWVEKKASGSDTGEEQVKERKNSDVSTKEVSETNQSTYNKRTRKGSYKICYEPKN